MITHKETGICHGRGFVGSDPSGLLAKINIFLTTAGPSGPEWYVHDDQSALSTNPYIVYTDTATPTVNAVTTGPAGGPPKFIKIGYLTSEAGNIRTNSYAWWDSSTHIGRLTVHGHRIYTYDDSDFQYYIGAGPDGIVITTRTGSNYNCSLFTDWTGDSNLVETPDKYGIINSGVGPSVSTILRMNTSGQYANFTSGNYYYICDFSSGTYVNYVRCNSIDSINNSITVSGVTNGFASGSLIGAYPHRWVAVSDRYNGVSISGLSYGNTNIPYYSHNSNCFNTGYPALGGLNGAVSYTYPNVINVLNPDDQGRYAVSKPLLYENLNAGNTSTSMNRAYGVPVNWYACDDTNMVKLVDGRIINSGNWLFHITDAYNNGILIPDPT